MEKLKEKEMPHSVVYGLLLGAMVIWGVQPVLVKWLLPEWSAVTITVVRYVLFSLMIFLYLGFRGEKFLPPSGFRGKIWYSLFLMGLGLMLNNVLQLEGIGLTTVMNTTLIAATGPVNTAFFAVLFLRERLSLVSWLGIFVSAVGTLIVISDGSLGVILGIDFHLGDVLCFLSQLAWTLYSLIGIRAMKEVSMVLATAWAGFFCAVLTLIYGVAVNDVHVGALSLTGMLSFAYILFGGGILATLAWNVGMKEVGASLSAIFINFMPIIGMASGWWFLGEEITWAKVIGAGFVSVGVWMTTLWKKV